MKHTVTPKTRYFVYHTDSPALTFLWCQLQDNKGQKKTACGLLKAHVSILVGEKSLVHAALTVTTRTVTPVTAEKHLSSSE